MALQCKAPRCKAHRCRVLQCKALQCRAHRCKALQFNVRSFSCFNVQFKLSTSFVLAQRYVPPALRGGGGADARLGYVAENAPANAYYFYNNQGGYQPPNGGGYTQGDGYNQGGMRGGPPPMHGGGGFGGPPMHGGGFDGGQRGGGRQAYGGRYSYDPRNVHDEQQWQAQSCVYSSHLQFVKRAFQTSTKHKMAKPAETRRHR